MIVKHAIKSISENNAYELTEIGNAERQVAVFGKDFRFVSELKKFVVWDKNRWSIDNTGAMDRMAKDCLRRMKLAAAQMEDAGRANDLWKHAHASETSRGIKAMLDRVTKEEGVSRPLAMFDTNPYLLNVGNGTLDLKTATLAKHSREDYITKLIPVDYRADAPCDRWLQFIHDIFAGNERVMLFAQRVAGLCLTGDTSERTMFTCYGNGANGKSTWINTLSDLLEDYAVQLPASALMLKRDGGGIPNDIAQMKGARLVTVIETEDGQRLAESLMKQITGGTDKMSARFLYGEYFSFKPECKILMGTNHLPTVRGTDQAIWDRFKLIPFTQRFARDQQDRDLPAKLREEFPGILRWCVEGCMDWQRLGLATPEEVSNATEGYREKMDTLGDFIDTECVQGGDCTAGAGQLYDRYKIWATLNGENAVNQRRFGTALSERGFDNSGRDGAGRVEWKGIGVKA